MTFDPNDPTFQWIQAIHRDVAHLRDNHLAHVNQDLQALKLDVNEIKGEIAKMQPVIEELSFLTSRFGRKLLFGLLVSISIILGVPMGMETL